MIAVEVARHADQFQCRTCKWGRHCDDSNPAPIDKWEIPGVIVSRTCLLPMVTDDSHAYLRLYRHYKNHLLPHRGGLLDQPHAYLEAMEILDAALNSHG